MSVHILQDGHYALVRCTPDESVTVIDKLKSNGFECGKKREVSDIPSLLDFNVKHEGSWDNIDGEKLRELLQEAGLDIAPRK